MLDHPLIFFPNTPPPAEVSAMGELLRRASDSAAAGDIDSAVTHTRAAYSLAASSGFGLGVATCLRLPMYLQRAGRSSEAWVELQALLSPDHPALNYGVSGRILWLASNHLRIYDKMRIFLQREGRPALAACYSALSYVCLGECLRDSIADLKAHHISAHSTRERLRVLGTPESIERALSSNMRRAGLLRAMPQLVSWTSRTLKARLLAADDLLLDQIRGALGVTESYP